jgi:hypothetical protein
MLIRRGKEIEDILAAQMVMPERSRRQLSSASSSNGNVGHSFASDGSGRVTSKEV